MREISGGAELTPLGKGGGSVELEIVSAVEVASRAWTTGAC
jgi:hypothetical protein